MFGRKAKRIAELEQQIAEYESLRRRMIAEADRTSKVLGGVIREQHLELLELRGEPDVDEMDDREVPW